MTKTLVGGCAMLLVASAGAFAVGCKKDVDPSAFDAGAAAPSVAVVATAPVPSVADVPDAAVAPLNSAVPIKKVAPKASASVTPAASAKRDLPSCANARSFCGNPKVGTNAKIKEMCDQFTAECKSLGGAL